MPALEMPITQDAVIAIIQEVVEISKIEIRVLMKIY